jgi:CheY-like chemotaxis protein
MRFSTILLVDDDTAHSTLVERNLRRVGFNRTIIKLDDGQKVMDWLEQNQSDNITPEVPFILLDINMPMKNGIEVLAEIKGSEETNHVPVVMLTTTDDPREIQQCYKLGCNAYVTKPVIHDEFKEKIRELGLFINLISSPQEH